MSETTVEPTDVQESKTPRTPLHRKALIIGGAVAGLTIAGLFVFKSSAELQEEAESETQDPADDTSPTD